jgi:hypothetical protein
VLEHIFKTQMRDRQKSEVAMNQKSPKQIRKFASAIYKGHSLQSAMLDAGYSPSTARRGKAALSKPLLEALARETHMLQLLGRMNQP